MSEDRILIVGLGNPGKQYDKTRHNVGFTCVDELGYKFNSVPHKEKFETLLSDTTNYLDYKIITAKPQTYMNNSGQSVRRIADFYKISVENIIVIHDDIDLELGKVKIKRGGGHAGHNGLRSLDQHIGKNYLRVRIGVGHPGDKDLVADFVLSKFSKGEQIIINGMIGLISDNFEFVLSNKFEEFITKIRQ